MDNNDFKQQFTQDIKTSTKLSGPSTQNNRGFFIFMIVITCLMILQLIVSIVILTNTMSRVSEPNEEAAVSETGFSEPEDEYASIYNDEGFLTALAATCQSEKGVVFTLDEDNTYQKTNSDSPIPETGTYTIVRGSVVNFTGSNSEQTTLFYDGYALTDGTNFYECEAPATSETQPNE